MSNSDNAARAPDTFAGSINRALDECLKNPDVLVGGQLVKYGVAGLTTGLYAKYPNQFITYSVSESLMNSATMGLALAGKRPVCIHVRMDFLLSGMDSLFNQIPAAVAKGHKLPCVFIVQVGKGMGQGAMHSKDLTAWFERFQGWKVCVPQNPTEAYEMLKESIMGDVPVMFVAHRELFDLPDGKEIVRPEYIKLCGASQRHEREFYGTDNASL
jgi:pyruvate/2-oxoglutarate/acetoin dehydrogenase E1 component